MRGPETRLRKKIVAAILEKYPKAYIRKIHGNAFQNIGIPDLVCCINGFFFGLEVKRPKKKPTPAQLIEMSRIKKAKGFSGVITSPQETLQLISNCLESKT